MPILFLALLFLLPLPAHAGQAEAKDFARSQNCTVTGITPTAMETGSGGGETVYKATCLISGTANEEEKKANGTLLIRCNGALCTLLKKGE